MGFTVEQECPQCGAPIELDEADHLMECPYCGVNHFLSANDYFRFVLPSKTEQEDTFYAPYLRFKGNVFYCDLQNVGYRIVDITHLGIPITGLPISLGLRPQAMKMRFVNPKLNGSYIRFSLKAIDIINRAGKLSTGPSSKQILHRAFIGETLNLIYLPLYLKNDRLYDGVIDKPVQGFNGNKDVLEQALLKAPKWKIGFMATICPHCGWNLTGKKDSIVLTCSNCESAWEVVKGRFNRVRHVMVPSPSDHPIYLPFWKIKAEATAVEISTFPDFIRLTNQPRVLGQDWENEPMHYWSPAFKIRPKVFLNLSRQFTIAQKRYPGEEKIPGKDSYPVTLPLSEAVQALKVILAGSTLYKKNIYPLLPEIRFKVVDSLLVYLPFVQKGQELVQEQMQISINRNTLEFGRKL